MATSEIVSSASTTVNAERGRRATSILSAVRTLANDEADVIGEGDDRIDAGRKLGSDDVKTARSAGASALRPETSRFVKRLADETIVTDDASDRAVELIEVEEEEFGAVVVADREPSLTPPTTACFCSGATRGGSC
jgi:hypothetical protein